MKFRHKVLPLAFFCLLLVFFIPPIIPFHRFPLTSFWNEWSSGVIVLLAWAISWLSWSKRVVITLLIIPWMVWGAAWLLAALLGEYEMIGPVYWTALFWVVGALTLIVVGELKSRFGRSYLLTAIAIALLFSGLFQSIFGLLRFYGLLTWFSSFFVPTMDDRMLGLLNYPTITGFSIWLSLFGALYLFWRGKIRRFGLIISILIMGFAIIATGNRSSILYGFCFLALGLITYIRARASGTVGAFNRNRLLSSIIVASLLLCFMVPLFSKLNRFMSSHLDALGYIQRHGSISQAFERKSGDFWGIRGSEFRKAIYLAKSHFWTGVGPGNYPYQSFRLDSVLQGTVREGSVNSHSHNIFSMILAEEGIVGIIALSIGIFILLAWWWRMGANYESCFVGSVLAVFLVYSNLEYPLWYLNFLVIFLIFSAVAAPTVEMGIDNAWVRPLLAITTLVVGGLVAVNFAQGFEQVSSVQSHQNLDGESLNKLSEWAVDRFMEPFVLLVLERYTFPQPEHIKSQLRRANKEIHRLPMPKALLDKAILLDFQGHSSRACALAKRTANSYPHVLDLYASEMSEYMSRKGKLPANPLALNKCFDSGYLQWKAQWKH